MEIADYLSNFLHYGLSFVIIISAIVFIHEFGHFWVARRFGVKVDEFSIGFGKEIYGWTDSVGTRWKISLVPLGGFVKMHGDEDGSSKADAKKLKKMSKAEQAQSFYFKPLWQKALIVVAGPAINFLLAFVIYFGVFWANGKTEIEHSPTIGRMIDGGVAQKLGMKVGDKIVSIGGEKVEFFSDILNKTMLSPSVETEIVVERAGAQQSFKFVPQNSYLRDKDGQFVQVRLGIQNDPELIVRKNEIQYGLLGAAKQSVIEIYEGCEKMLTAIWQIVSGVRSAKDMSGPVKIVEYSGQFTEDLAKSISCVFNGVESLKLEPSKDKSAAPVTCGDLAISGFLSAVLFMAMLSTMLGLMNLLPIPMLDGGHLLFYVVEAVLRRPASEKVQELAFRAGFAFLVSLMLYVTYNDIVSIFQRYILS